MSSKYHVNNTAQSNGDHEVHKEDCDWFKLATNTTYLGEFHTCSAAVATARLYHNQVNGCATCAPDCHTS